MGTLTTFSWIGSGTEFFTTYTIGVPEYTQPLTPKKCDVLVDNTGRVFVYSNSEWKTPTIQTSPCVSAVSSLPAGAAQVGYDCASKCFYAVPATAKDAAGNTLSFD